MENRARDQIQVHVSLILVFIDDYTGKRIFSPKIWIQADGAGKAVYKKEGYVIFTNLWKEEVTVLIQIPGYQPVRKTVFLYQTDNREPFVKIRLQPGKSYSLFKERTILSGTAEAFSKIRASSFQSRHYYRLLNDYKNESGNRIYIFNSKKVDLEEKSFLIWQKTRKEYEFVTIGKAKGEELESFEIEEPLKKEYKKAATKLSPVFSGQADEKGSFLLVMGELEGKEAEVILEILTEKEGDRKEIVTTVRVGKENTLY